MRSHYIEVDGVELAYNPEWAEEEGDIEGYSPCKVPVKW